MNNKYFENIPQIGTLYFEQELFSYENIPIVFVCMDKDHHRYLCICDDVIEEESWVITKISNKELLSILTDESTVLSVYKNKNVIVANKPFGKEIEYTFNKYDKIDRDELPLSDQYLEMKEYLSDYINKISNSSFVELFLLSDLICQNNFNDFLQYILNVNISHRQLHQNDSDIHESLITNTLNCQNGLSFEIELEYEKSCNVEQKEWSGYNTMIYAA